ncbi:threonine synthase [Tilletia horrida]|nr:threonine synthase [Tilletia horrida]
MKYLSTRGGNERLTFEQAVLTGLAPNGGLYIPEQIPSLPANWAADWAKLSFPELSYQVVSRFIPSDPAQGGIPSEDLKQLINRSYSTFRSDLVSPLKQLGDNTWCLELWHGPTFAFKDVALQFLGNLFEYFLQRRNAAKGTNEPRERLTVLGATSGDTGSAAIAGLRSKADVDIFILFPKGRVSPIQEAQMTTVLDANVHNLAVEGTFDDCQDIVKTLFSDAEFNAKHRLGAINSINFARILAQIVYYFSAYFQLAAKLGVNPAEQSPEIQFIVPTGNFGDILAGYYAKRMGLPIKQLVVATNENDILQRFWATGRYEKQATDTDASAQTAPVQGSSDGAQVGGVKATLSPAMDILVSSNFERLLWDLAFSTSTALQIGGDEGRKAAETEAGATLKQWMDELKKAGRMEVTSDQLELARRDFAAERVSDEQIKQTILRYYSKADPSASARKHAPSYLVDPHTAVGFEAADRLRSGSKVQSSTHQVVLSTAHPAKFSDAVVSSLESAGADFDFERDVLPPEMHGLLEKERRVRDVRLADGQGDADFAKLVDATRKVLDGEMEKRIGAAKVAGSQQTESV